MPTPSEALPLEADAVAAAESPPPAHTTCPPETDRVGGWRFDPEEEAQTVEEDGGSSRAPAVNASASANVNVVEPKTAEEDCAIGTEDNRESSNQDETEATSSSMAAVATAPLRSSNTPLAVAVQSRSAQEDREDTPSSQFSSDSDPAASTAREVKISSPTSSARVLPKDASASPKPVSEVIDYKPDALPNYEFSNERVSASSDRVFLDPMLIDTSSFLVTRHPSYEPAASLPAHSSQTGRYTMSTSRLSTSIWPSHFYADISAFKVYTISDSTTDSFS